MTASAPKIQVLPEQVVGRIAAGEVVERPAAVVKELLENSLDAGSTAIQIDIKDGGRTLIKVTDDGEGMGPEDASLAFQRHATSKLRSEHDLWGIRTMGFRGEALPSIAAVAKVRLRTCLRGAAAGVVLQVTGGKLGKAEQAGPAPGTRIEVADLFFNTPARKKFLKTAATEFSHVCQVVQHAALAWPQVAFRLTHNGQPVLDYARAQTRRDRVLQVYGSRLLEQMVEVRAERQGVRLEGFASGAPHVRTTKTPQDLFVNRRPVKNPTVTHAIYDGYGPSLAKGRHPVFVLFLHVDPQRVDVNVHPTKREIRFADQELIHQTVRHAIRATVGGAPPELRPDVPAHLRLQSFAPAAGGGRVQGTSAFRPSWAGWPAQTSPPVAEGGRAADAAQSLPGTGHDPARSTAVHETELPYATGASVEVVPLGQLSRTFLVAEVGGELQVIDQHTAHERVLFERLWRAWLGHHVPAQALLMPEPFDLPPHLATLLARYLPDLEKLGLEIAPFGLNSFVVRSVPAPLGGLDYPSLIQDLVDDLARWNAVSPMEERVRPVLATLACHSAVRAGRAMELPEIKRLVEDWVAEGLPMTCPHGRRVALRLPADELARIFGRNP